MERCACVVCICIVSIHSVDDSAIRISIDNIDNIDSLCVILKKESVIIQRRRTHTTIIIDTYIQDHE